MSRNYEIISCDGHVIEPPDLWQRYLPKDMQDRAPRLVKDPLGGDAWELIPGTPPMPIGLVTNAGQYGKRYEDLHWYGSTYESIKAGAYEGNARVEEQDFDHIDAEVIFPSQRTMSVFMAQEDDDFHLAGLEAYNTWISTEFNACAPDRLFGLAQMPAVDVKTAIKWMRDAKGAGFKGVIISGFPSGNAELSEEDDPFWEACEEEQVIVHIHTGLSQAGKRRTGAAAGTGKQAATAQFGKLPDLKDMGGAIGEASKWMATFIYSEMFDRFPGLQIVSVENGAGWIPNFLEHMDDHYWRNRTWTNNKLKNMPSSYFQKNWYTTFIREPFAVASRHWIGVDRMLFSTDYPHHRHDWPYSRRVIEESMAGVPATERHAMLAGNAIRLYGLGE